jgi:dTDP-glucose pyrophosphorylase
MNILIPMAGHGSRFQAAGYSFPKPLIDVNHKPMIQVVTDNLNIEGRHIFLVLKEHYEKYSLRYLLPLIVQPRGAEIIQVDHVTQGAACTALLARELIDNDDELIIANSDQWVDWDSRHFLTYMRSKKADGGILTFFSTHPKWSFVKVDELSSKITEVAEKKPISNLATVGIYYFKRGRDFVAAADRMIQKNIRVNNEFYIAPTYNEMIADGKTLLPYPVAEMKGLGTPEDLERFLKDHQEKRRAS